jgi:hypothetical protein
MNKKFDLIRLHRSGAATCGAFYGSGFDFFTGAIVGAVWLLGEVISFVVFDNETNE